MLTVDLAFQECLASEYPDAEIRYYSIEGRQPSIARDAGLSFDYESIIDNFDHVQDSSAIVFWGDFLHSRSYIENDLNERGIDAVSAYRYLFLNDCAPRIFEKVLVFGESLITEDAFSSTDKAYVEASHNFFSQVNHVYMRDVFSAMKVVTIKGKYDQNFLGADCAMLLDFNELLECAAHDEEPEREMTKKSVGVFYSRTLMNMEHFFQFANEAAEWSGRRIEWAEWFPILPTQPAAIKKKFPKIHFDGSPTTVFDVYRKIRSFEFVITDTYHLALTSWRLGVPAVCIGRGAKLSQTTIDDKKKETLFCMYNAEPFYLFAEYFADPEWRKMAGEHVNILMTTPALKDTIMGEMDAHAASARTRVRGALKNILDRKF